MFLGLQSILSMDHTVDKKNLTGRTRDPKQTSDLGFLQACLLAGLAMKFRWRKWYVRDASDQSLEGMIFFEIFLDSIVIPKQRECEIWATPPNK